MPEPTGRAAEFYAEYKELLHAMQSGIAMMLEYGSTEGTPKHLRVGVNTSLLSEGALAGLLIKKGIVTEEEYYKALRDMAQEEVNHYTRRIRAELKQRTGKDVEIKLH